jgi:hypothetical protein
MSPRKIILTSFGQIHTVEKINSVGGWRSLFSVKLGTNRAFVLRLYVEHISPSQAKIDLHTIIHLMHQCDYIFLLGKLYFILL